jgi:hypothetical protein
METFCQVGLNFVGVSIFVGPSWQDDNPLVFDARLMKSRSACLDYRQLLARLSASRFSIPQLVASDTFRSEAD